MEFSLRKAQLNDVPILTELIKASVRGLQSSDYSKEQLDGAIESVYGVDTQLINDGTYFVAEAKGVEEQATVIVGCGGWSKRKTLYGADHFTKREDSLLDPQIDAARIRAFFIHPEWARQGIGTLILQECERKAVAAGFRKFEMGATLTGVPMYLARGYKPLENLTVPLSNGQALAIVKMGKNTDYA